MSDTNPAREEVIIRLRATGYWPSDIEKGLAFADAEGATTNEEIFTACLSRILYSDEQLANGARYS